MTIFERNQKAQDYLDKVAFRKHARLMRKIDVSLTIVFGLSLAFFVLSVILGVF